jgi:hypothetical protein
VDVSSYQYDYDADQDTATVYFDKPVVDDSEVLSICDEVVLGNDVDMVGVLSKNREMSIREGKLLYRYASSPSILVIDGHAPPGFSGGPVIDVQQRCVIAIIRGNNCIKPNQSCAQDITGEVI